MALKPVTVSQLNQYIARVISMDPILGITVVKGEISYIKYHGTGNLYFTISDSQSRLSCFMYYEAAKDLDFVLEEGDSVILRGNIRVYEKNGTYSLNVKEVEKKGMGDLAKEFLFTKTKLEKEGLFDTSHKKMLPKFPKNIGIITSETGAAVRDIVKIISTRYTLTNITIFPAKVQGDMAAAELTRAVDFCSENYSNFLDLLIIGRGGGAPEDLACFNNEELARAIYRCKIPIISAVGHEIDFSISDFVADKRAETPTAAAQMAVPDMQDLQLEMNNLLSSMGEALAGRTEYSRLKCEKELDYMKNAIMNRIKDCEHRILQQKTLLQENNPMTVLDKGYSYISDDNGKNLSSVSKIDFEETYTVSMRDGKAFCRFIDREGSGD